MASVSLKKLFEPIELTTTNQTIYTGETGRVLKNGRIAVTNYSGAVAKLTVYIVPSGGTAGNGNIYIPAVSIAGPNPQEFNLPDMKAGDTLVAKSDTGSALVIHALGGTLHS